MALVFLASSIALSSPSTTGKGFGVAPASKPTINKATASSAPSRPAVADFEKWAVDNGIKKIEKIDVGEFNGERGVVASAEIAAGARVLSVPSSLTLQVNSLSKCPRWCEEETWRTAKWDARLAMMLLHEEADKRSSLKPWLAQLPRDFSTPVLWSQPTQPFEAMGYQALSSSIMRQADEWEASRQRAPGSPSAEQWTWAMNVVRSRAFSGPYAPGTFIGALLQLFGASTLALGYAVSCGSRLPPQAAIGRLAVAQTPRRASHDTARVPHMIPCARDAQVIIGGAGAADQAFNFFLLSVVFVLCNDFLFGPRLTTAKRYVLCPWIDFLNHDGTLGQSEVAYEYAASTRCKRRAHARCLLVLQMNECSACLQINEAPP